MKQVGKFLCRSTILPLAQKLQIVMQSWSHPKQFDELVQTSLKVAFDYNRVYRIRIKFIESSGELHREPCNLERLHSLNSKCSEAYKEFDSVMSSFEWNPDVRSEVKRNEECRGLPFGTPADIAVEYIFELCQEIHHCSGLHQEKQQAEKYLQILYSIFGYCYCNAVMLQWLATLLCLSTLGSTTHNTTLDLSKHKDLLLNLVNQEKDDINDLYPMISLILGNDFQQKVAPLLESIGVFQAVENHQQLKVREMSPNRLLYHVLLIKLLAVASLGPSCIGVYDIQITDQLLISHTSYASCMLLLVASGMKQQVEAFQRRALAEDRLCQQLITALTTAKIKD